MILKLTNRPQEHQASQDVKDVLWTWFMKAILYYEHSNVLLKTKKESSSQSIAIINSNNGDIGMNCQKKGDNLQYMDLIIQI